MMSVRQILVLGGGFAGLWSALGAARKLDELDQGPDAVEVTLVNRDAFHSIHVRNYEADLTSVRVPLDDVGVRGRTSDYKIASRSSYDIVLICHEEIKN
jgi:NADH dehydrogenase FAD-containing subunit